MNATTIQALGQVAGIGGLAVGIFLILARDMVGRLALPKLTRKYRKIAPVTSIH